MSSTTAAVSTAPPKQGARRDEANQAKIQLCFWGSIAALIVAIVFVFPEDKDNTARKLMWGYHQMPAADQPAAVKRLEALLFESDHAPFVRLFGAICRMTATEIRTFLTHLPGQAGLYPADRALADALLTRDNAELLRADEVQRLAIAHAASGDYKYLAVMCKNLPTAKPLDRFMYAFLIGRYRMSSEYFGNPADYPSIDSCL